MASKYKRHSTGGRFKKRSASDLGSGAIKAQADIVIDSLKLQQTRSSEYASDYVKGMRGVENTEEWNQNLLSQLEDKAFQNRREAIKVRQDREVESLEGKAAEYGKQAEFWKNFSTTYSKQWGDLAQGAIDLGQRIQGEKQLSDFYGSEEWQNLADLQGPVLSLFIENVIENKDNPEAQNAAVELVSGLHGWSRLDQLQKMKTKIPDLLENLEVALRENGQAWNEDTIPKDVQSLATQIQIQYGLAGTREGKALERHMLVHASTLTKRASEDSRVGRDATKRKNAFTNLYSVLKNINDLYPNGITDAKEKKHADNLIRAASLKAFLAIRDSWYKDSSGKIIKGIGKGPEGKKEILKAYLQEYSLYDSSRDGLREALGLIPDDDNPGRNMNDRYKGEAGELNLDHMVTDVLDARVKEQEERQQKLDNINENNLRNTFITLVNNEDVTDPETQKQLRQLDKDTKKFPDLNNLVNGALAFKYNERNLNSLYRALGTASENGDIKYMDSVIPYLSEPQKSFWMKKLDNERRFNEIFDKEIMTGKVRAVTNKIQQSSLELSRGQLSDAHQLFKQQLRNYAMDYMSRNPTAEDTDIKQYAEQKATEELNSGAGVWRIINDPSGKGTFAAFVQDEIEWVNGTGIHNPLYSGLWRTDRLTRNLGVPSNEFEQKLTQHGLEGLLNHKDHGVKWNLVNIDDVDKWLKKTIKGETIGTHPAVEALYKSQLQPGYSGKSYTRTEIMNIIAEKATSKRTEEYTAPSFRGSTGTTKVTTTKPRTVLKESELKDQEYYIEETEYIPRGQLDKAEHYVNSSNINVPNYRQYSISDQTAIGALLWSVGEDGQLPWSKQLEDLYSKSTELGVPPTELIDGDPNIMNYNYFNLPVPRFRTTTMRPK